MDRGSAPLKAHMEGCSEMEIRQTRRGFLQELLGCEASNEFKYFVGSDQIAHSLDDTNCFMRICCPLMYEFTTVVKELNTDAEVMTIHRPFACAAGACKCCCYQGAEFSSGGQPLGSIKENYYWW